MILLGADDPMTIRGERLGSLKLRLLLGVDAWLGISEAFLVSLEQAGVPRERFHRIYTALDVERFCPPSVQRVSAPTTSVVERLVDSFLTWSPVVSSPC